MEKPKPSHTRKEAAPSQARITSLRELQGIQKQFVTMNGIQNTPESAFSRLVEEVDECRGALRSGDKKELKGELADIIIFVATLANEAEIDLEQAVTDKMARNYVKYNPFRRKQLLDQGIPSDKVHEAQREQWDRGKDHDFIT